MGNTQTLDVTSAATTQSRHVQSSLAADMQQRVQAIVAAEAALNRGVTDIQLSGAGEGHPFMANVVTSSETAVPAGGQQVQCYLAGDAHELGLAGAAAIAALPALSTLDGWAEAGSSDGRRWMGLILYTLPGA